MMLACLIPLERDGVDDAWCCAAGHDVEGDPGLPMSSPRTKAVSRFVGPRDPTEVMLSAIWEDLLGRGPVGIRESFAALGGDSTLLARMIDCVEETCGRKVPQSLRSDDATIEEVARALVQTPSAAATPRYRAFFARNVEPARGESAPPFFFLHGDLYGHGLYCLRLAGHLGKDQPFYALTPHGLDGRPVPGTIEGMASSHLETLLSLKPEGPYRLGGLCNGAFVAFEMARQLWARGQKVERLILIAPRFPSRESALATWCRYYLGRLQRLVRLPAREQAAFFKEKMHTCLSVIANMVNLRARHNLGGERVATPEGGSRRTEDARDRVMHDYTKVMNAYTPGRYAGPVTILWGRAELAQGPEGPAKIWRKVARQLEIHQVPGGHLTCLTIHVRALAERLRACLDSEPTVNT